MSSKPRLESVSAGVAGSVVYPCYVISNCQEQWKTDQADFHTENLVCRVVHNTVANLSLCLM